MSYLDDSDCSDDVTKTDVSIGSSISATMFDKENALERADAELDQPMGQVESFYREHCIYLPFMLGWFLFSILLSTYNTYVFSSGHIAFPCPLLLTAIHFSLQWCLSFVLSSTLSDKLGGERVATMNWTEFMNISLPCGIVTAMDIGLSNLALVRINLTLYTLGKASAPIFVLMFAVMFRLEKLSWGLVGVVALITIGEVIICAYGELDFDLLGFLCVVGAAVASGLRWTLVQFILKTLDPPLESSIVTMRVISPSMTITMLMFSLMIEKPWIKLNSEYDDFEELFDITLKLGLIGGFLAIAMVTFEFCLILRSSAIVLMLGGVLKEILTIILGTIIFGDNLNWRNGIGGVVIFSGVILYKYIYHQSKQGTHDSIENTKYRVKQYSKIESGEDLPSLEDTATVNNLKLVHRIPSNESW
eukprot:CAMPEP_0116068716 /NCGR_PEP_ID=MMETSP0322-20121206/11836_1 /TAXON_ID=163516 /ORGANISM="Leptocylindrus danicus var. apora, Strain B651" /LENGTH=417 /DNA_ID=CAMNT_0003555899 /DNA_START=213 /DNA_END=1463 /DNA_ORIENTATION=+